MRQSISVTGALSGTPLSSEHELLAKRGVRTKYRPVPWSAFRRDRIPPAVLEMGLDEMRRLAVGEYLAVDGFSRAVSALAMAGAPIDLVAATARVVTDESRHADLVVRMAALYAGCSPRDLRVEIPASQLDERERIYAGRLESIEDLDLWMMEVPAFGETLACASLMECRRLATEPVSRALYNSILSDEVRHARLGWYYLIWRSRQWTQAQRQRIANRVGVVVRESVQRFGRGQEPPRGCGRAARSLGLLDTKAQTAVVKRVMRQEVVPAFDALGFGASHAWRTAP